MFDLTISGPLPFFAEFPYYVWGQVDYHSEGDCGRPTDRNWSWLELRNRETGEFLSFRRSGHNSLKVEGVTPASARAAVFICARCVATTSGLNPTDYLEEWDHAAVMKRAARVQANFERPELKPFDFGHAFWGNWRWIGWYGSEYTWVGRWILDSVVRNDTRAVPLCAGWLRNGSRGEAQSIALRYALNRFTGKLFETDQQWVDWYFEGGGEAEYPLVDIETWKKDLQAIHDEA